MTLAGLDPSNESIVEHAVRLFTYLARVQQLRNQPVHNVDRYESVSWLADLPESEAIQAAHREVAPDPDDALLVIDRVARTDPPQPYEQLTPWLAGDWDAAGDPPALRRSIPSIAEDGEDPDGGPALPTVLRLEDHHDVRGLFEDWLPRWRAWSERELLDRADRTVYTRLFSMYTELIGSPEDLELVCGVGCLSWSLPGSTEVKRHLLTIPMVIHFDPGTGRLTVRRAENAHGLTVELEMLDAGLTGSAAITAVREDATGFEANPLHREAVAALIRRLVHALDASGEYRDHDSAAVPAPQAVARFAPAIILRRRTRRGLVEAFQQIARQMEEAREVPAGLLPMIDPDYRPEVAHDDARGAVVTVDDELYLPIPVNDQQLRVIQSVERKAQTLVQGPPGTGKTHTAAALLSHLLAQGRRVLITAHTDRALKEVRAKLPDGIRPLAVAVVGTSREDMSDLRVAVERIAQAADEHDPDAAEQAVQTSLDRIDVLRRERAQRYRRLVTNREAEVRLHEHAGYRGTLAEIAQQYRAEAPRFAWLGEVVDIEVCARAPVTAEEITEWHRYLLDSDLTADEPAVRLRPIDLRTVPPPDEYTAMVAAHLSAAQRDEQYRDARNHPVFGALRELDESARSQLRRSFHDVADTVGHLSRRPEAWTRDALADACSGRTGIWQSRESVIIELTRYAAPLVDQIGHVTEVAVDHEDVDGLIPWANLVLARLHAGVTIKPGPRGRVRTGAFTAKEIRQAQAHGLFDRIRVNGLPPTTPELLHAFLTWTATTKTLAALDRAWPQGTAIPPEDTSQERLQWHITELEHLHGLVELGRTIDTTNRQLAALRIPRPDWNNPAALHSYVDLIDAAEAADQLAMAADALGQLEAALADAMRPPGTADCVRQLRQAVLERDPERYAATHRHLERLHVARTRIGRRDALGDRLSARAPTVRLAIERNPRDPRWVERLAEFEDAWRWVSTGAWLRGQADEDVNALQQELASTEEQIRVEVERLASVRAWRHAVASDRLTGSARADLRQYAQLVRDLGKGTGRYAAQKQVEIREALDRCRPAVPAWIMPIYRIAEQLTIRPNMFDVVLVDEASQAGLEATLLPYLAPRIVVVGDDRQVSPSAVGIEDQQLRDLARLYLRDDRYRASWQNPRRSLFDEAKMRFGDLITLTEHRRCMPEIIGFSNQIAYEPEGIRLVPVRQYGADRLDPIRTVHVPNGYVRGTTRRINPAEADAIADHIEKCLSDPRYDDLTFGVISLLGPHQAEEIKRRLLGRIPGEEWAKRELRCGDAAAFQGAERDVMFLSMVAAVEPGGPRVRPLTGETYLQRFNVAASRAKDQMWLFHSVTLADLGHPEDLRRQLLAYCQGVALRGSQTADGSLAARAPEDRKVSPFQSLFEQRVFNCLYDRGYTVFPQFEALGYFIDLVVMGSRARLAIECDGEPWHGPERYAHDLHRQRELERCGWRFFRIRETRFYADRSAVLEELRHALRELDIHPAASVAAAAPVTHRPAPDRACAEIDYATAAREPSEEPEVPVTQPATDRKPTKRQAPVSTTAVPPLPAAARQPLTRTSRQRRPRTLARYQQFRGTLVPAAGATLGQRVAGLLDIVRIEGPVVGHRIHTAYVKGSGGSRVGRLIGEALDGAIRNAVRNGRLLEDNPLGEPGLRPRTYRLPGQPPVRMRSLGPREFEHVPPRELAAMIVDVARDTGWDSEVELIRATLNLLELKRLTTQVHARFSLVLPLARALWRSWSAARIPR